MSGPHEPEPSSLGGLHHREGASASAAAAHESHANGGRGAGGVGLDPVGTPTLRRKRSKDGASNFWGDVHRRLRGTKPVDDNYAKYGKRRVKKKRTKLEGHFLIGAVCFVSFVVGFTWMHLRPESPPYPHRTAPQQHLRRGSDASRAWKPRPPPPPPDDERRINTWTRSLYIPRFDARKYLANWDREARHVASDRNHPRSVELDGWTVPAAFRAFPYARQTHGPVKSVDGDYGGISYRSLRNEDVFAREIPEDGDGPDRVTPGGFDPSAVAPRENLKRRNKNKKKDPGNYPRLDGKGRKVMHGGKDATYAELVAHYDDDEVNVYAEANDPKVRAPRACVSTEFSGYYFPSCNNFHERGDVGRVYDDPAQMIRQRPENEAYVKYLSHGYFRDVWVLEDGPWIWPDRYPKEKDYQPSRTFGVEDEGRTNELVAKAYRSTVLKTFQMKHEFEDDHFEEVQLEAIIMERMKKSPWIMDIYGHCGFSTIVEVVPIEFEEAMVPGEGMESTEDYEKRNKHGVKPKNNFTAEEKLMFVLEQAESLADLHGFEEGVIVHDDVQMCQWLRTPEGHLKLGDFNRATIMQWDEVRGGYCRFNNGEAFSQYRAPEEYDHKNKNLNEQIDTFSFGNNIFTMLTGLWNFYDQDDDGVTQKDLIGGKRAYIDPRYRERSFAEGKLVELMELCWKPDPDERISMFGAVEFLREAVRENEARKKRGGGDRGR